MKAKERIARLFSAFGLAYFLCVGPSAYAASLFAVPGGGDPIDAGPLVITPYTPTSIDVYLDAGNPDNLAFTVNLYTDGSTLDNIVPGDEAIGNWQDTYWYQLDDNCGGACSSQIVLVVSLNVTLSDGGNLTGDGWAAILNGQDIVQEFILATTLVPEPNQASLLLAGLGTLMLIAGIRTPRLRSRPCS